MAKIMGPKFPGTVLVDLSELQDDLVDLPPGTLRGARLEKEGLADVLKELGVAIPNHGEEAEIHPAIYQRILDETAKIEKLRSYESSLEKLLEVCRETRGMKENNREDDISAIASKAEDTAERGKNTGLRAHFEKTIKYRSSLAEKAAGTRRKNEEAKAEAAKSPPPAAGGGGQPPTEG